MHEKPTYEELEQRIQELEKAESKHKQVEMSLRDTEAILKAAMDCSPVAIAIANAPDGKLRYVNKAGLNMRGGTEEELVKGIDIDKYVSSWQMFHFDGTAYKRDEVPLARAIMYGETCSDEFVLKIPDAENRIVLANASPILDDKGNVKFGIVIFLDITERKRTEEASHHSEKQFKTLFMSMSDAFYLSEILFDDNGNPCDYRYIEVNPEFEQILGLSRDQIIGKRYKELVPVDTTEWLDAYFTVARTGTPLNYEFYSNEYQMYFETYSYQPTKGQVSVIIRNITKRKRVETKLQQAKNFAEKLIESANAMIIVRDAESKVHVFNKLAEEITGYTRQELLGYNWFEILVPRDKYPNLWKDFLESSQDRLPRLFENLILTKAGEERIISWQNTDLLENGEYSGSISYGIDITERKLTDETLKESEATLLSIFESAPMLMGIIELTIDDKIVHLYDNPATARFFNVEYKSTENMIANKLGAPKEAISEWLVHYRQSQKEGKPVRFEYLHPAPGGPTWLSATVSPIGPSQNGRIRFSYVAEDITEIKRSNMQLQKYADTQTILLREVNHRVKNNLAVIVSMLHKEEDLAKRKGKTSVFPLLRDLESRIMSLLTVHRMFSAANWQPLLLSQLCEKIIGGALKPQTDNRKIKISDSQVQVDSDQAHHLSMVINELATNSLKYTISDQARICIHVDISEDAGKIFLTFRDNGPGYPEKIVRNEYTGTSIGFDLITGIVEKSLRGAISFKNKNGAVTEIIFDKTNTGRAEP